MSNTYHAEFLDKEEDHLFRALNVADLVKTELSSADSMLNLYLVHARFLASQAYLALAMVPLEDRQTMIDARADIRAYDNVRQWIAGALQEGDIAFAESNLSQTGGDDDLDLEDDEAGRIPFAEA